MKLTCAFLVLAAAAVDHTTVSDRDSALDTNDNVAHSHLNGAGIQTQDEVVHDLNIRPDGQKGSNFNQVTRAPSPAPSGDTDMHQAIHVDADETGNTDQIDEQTGPGAIPTMEPTAFPTKDTASKDAGDENFGTKCCYNNICKPVGWVGAGFNEHYCNVWKCEVDKTDFAQQNFVGTFRKQTKVCSVEEHGSSFCSHTTCTFETNADSGSRKVIMVHSDHKEEVGGMHQCGFSKHADARGASRPGCDCICTGARRQDANDFQRQMQHISAASRTDGSDTTSYQYRGVVNGHDRTTNFDHTQTTSDFDANHNSNNFYSQHTNYNMVDTQGKFSNANANVAGGDGTTNGIDTTTATQYNENDQQYQGEHNQYGFHKKGVAHVHIDN